ncbi:hypothetical protein NHX12_030519, partial [Muraenolepis orangiensis]
RLLPCSRTGDGGLWSCCGRLRGGPASFFLLHAVGGALLFTTDGLIGSYAAFIYTYAVSPPLEAGPTMAGYLDSVFWAAVTAGRLAFIYLSYRFSPAPLLLFSLLGVVLVQCLLLAFSSSRVFLFIGTVSLGLCIRCATTVLVTSASTGEMVLQVLVGSVMQSQGSISFLVCGTTLSVAGLGLLLLLLYVSHLHRDSQRGTVSHGDDSQRGTVSHGDDSQRGTVSHGDDSQRGTVSHGDDSQRGTVSHGDDSQRGTVSHGDDSQRGTVSHGDDSQRGTVSHGDDSQRGTVSHGDDSQRGTVSHGDDSQRGTVSHGDDSQRGTVSHGDDSQRGTVSHGDDSQRGTVSHGDDSQRGTVSHGDDSQRGTVSHGDDSQREPSKDVAMTPRPGGA